MVLVIFKNTEGALDYLKGILTFISNEVREWEHKRAKIFLDWLHKKLIFAQREKTYNPLEDNYYKRKDIVHVDFGFNVGSEIGGERFAIILWAPQKSKNVTVIPITSEKIGSRHDPNIHVCLGELIEDGIVNWAKIEQIRCVSKMRVNYSRKRLKNRRVPDELMDRIDDVIKNLYTKKNDK